MLNQVGSFPSSNDFFNFILKWTPRAIVAGFTGYYSLGIAYDIGLMAAIDRIAIRILRYLLGYVGIGALMPTIQWYAAWGVRMVTALGAGLTYDFIERILRSAFSALNLPRSHPQTPSPLVPPPSPLLLKTTPFPQFHLYKKS